MLVLLLFVPTLVQPSFVTLVKQIMPSVVPLVVACGALIITLNAWLIARKAAKKSAAKTTAPEEPPCVEAPADVPAPTYRPTYKPSLRGSDDDDCVDDEDWSYTTKEGDVFTCERVAEKTKRCTIRFSEEGVRADDACKKTCGTCK